MFKHTVSFGVPYERPEVMSLECTWQVSTKEEVHCQVVHPEAGAHHFFMEARLFFHKKSHDYFGEVYDSSSKIFLSSGLLF